MSAILDRYREVAVASAPAMVGAVAFTVAALLIWQAIRARAEPPTSPWLRRAAVLGFVALGVAIAVDRASLFDDAFISLRYAANWLDGHGLVFNPGERVEGYTNFLWVAMVAGVAAVTGASLPAIALWGAVVCFALTLLVTARLSSHLTRPHTAGFVFPAATALLAVSYSFTSFGTTGMETACAALLVVTGALFLTARDDGLGALAAGAALILATLTRPDHALFYGAGGLALLAQAIRDRRLRPAVIKLGLYAAPFALYAIYLAWKVSYYGDLLPNTYYAKSADLTYWDQGARYAALFYLDSHLWLLALPLVAWLIIPAPSDGSRRFKIFAATSIALYNLYVIRVGGDFMHGRFFVSLLPLYLVAVEQLYHAVSSLPVRLAIASILAVTTTGGAMFDSTETIAGVADERRYYPVTDFDPITVGHSGQLVGQTLGRLRAGGVEPIVATSGVGMIGYYSGLEIVDRVGLTDETVAHLPLAERGRPGHEKWAPLWYIEERGAHFVRGGPSRPEARPYNRIYFPGTTRKWRIHRYDRELMRRLREIEPAIRFTDFERVLDDYIATLPGRAPAEVARDLVWMRRYYFDQSDDPDRLSALEAAAQPRADQPGN